MRPPLEGRRELKRSAEHAQRDLAERRARMGLVVEDRAAVSDAAKRLQMATTAEGVQAVAQHVGEAVAAPVQEFQERNALLERQMSSYSKAAQDLFNRSRAAQANSELANSVASGIAEASKARRDVGRAEQESSRDARFLGGLSREQRAAIEATRKQRDQQLQTLMSLSIDGQKEISDAIASARGDDLPNYGVGDATGDQYRHPKQQPGSGIEGHIEDIPPEELERRLQGAPRVEEEPDPLDEEKRKEYLRNRRGYIREVQTYKDRAYKQDKYE